MTPVDSVEGRTYPALWPLFRPAPHKACPLQGHEVRQSGSALA